MKEVKLTRESRDNILRLISEFKLDRPVKVIFKQWRQRRTNPQNSLLWKWHTEVAAEFSAFTGKYWTPEAVHYRFFCPKFLGGEVVELPDGSKAWAGETSSTQSTTELGDAMTAYQAWCIENEIDLTQPEEYDVSRGY